MRDKVAYNAYMAEYMLNRYHKRRVEAVVQLGGKCVDCGSGDDLEFDHADAKLKTAEIGKMFTSASNTKLAAELDKCVLRCKDCHLIKSLREGDIVTVEHGGGLSGKRNCLCDPCKEVRKQYMKKHKQASVAQQVLEQLPFKYVGSNPTGGTQ